MMVRNLLAKVAIVKLINNLCVRCPKQHMKIASHSSLDNVKDERVNNTHT
jgi:hypothetical protein